MGFTLTAIGGGGGAEDVTVMVDAAVLLASATDLAVSVTVAGEGVLAGAVYVIAAPDALEVLDSVPHAVPVHPAPDSAQVTPLFCESLCTVAVTFCVLPTCAEKVVGDNVTEITGVVAVMVTCATSKTAGLATATAAIVTVAGDGTAAGAVYVPFASILPCVASPPATPSTCQVTVVLAALETTAVNFCVVATLMETVGGSTETVTVCPCGFCGFDCTVPHPQTPDTATKIAAIDEILPRRTRLLKII